MGIVIASKNGEVSMSYDAWAEALREAIDNGWGPLGTIAPDPHFGWPRSEPWDRSNYCSSDYQTISAEDAAELADALERANAKWTSSECQLADEVIRVLRGGETTLG